MVNKSAVDHNTVSESKYDMTGKFIVTADELNIRATGDVEAEVIGTLYKDYVGEVVKADGEWIEIKSGDISGFVKAEYILTDDKASEYITSIGGLEKANYAVAAAKDAETDDQDETTEENQTDDTDTDSDDDDDTETPSEEDTEEVTEEQTTEAEETTTEEVTEEPTTETEEVTEEVTTEEPTTEAATEAHEQYSGDTGVHAAGGFSAEEVRLLAAIVYAESGSESYEGQVAVANVVLNRLYSGRWGGSLNDVIYAPYQFSATDTWAFSDVYSNGAPDTTMCAVYDALNGYNNIGGYLSFRPIWYLDPSELDPDAKCLHDVKLTDEVRELITYYWAVQGTDAFKESDIRTSEKWDYYLEQGIPVLFWYGGFYYNEEGKNVFLGHAVVAYGVERGHPQRRVRPLLGRFEEEHQRQY